MTPTNHDGKDATLIRSPIRFCISGPNESIPTVDIDIDAISGNTILKTLLDDEDRFQSEDLVVFDSRCQFPNLSGVGKFLWSSYDNAKSSGQAASRAVDRR